MATAADVLSCTSSGWYDADGDPEGYLYEWVVNGVVKGTDATADGTVFKKGNRVVCRLTPWDGADEGITVSSRPVVIDNAPPTLKSLTIGPADPTAGTPLLGVLGETSDPDGERVRVDVDWYVNSKFVSRGGALVGDHYRKKDTIFALGTPFDGDAKGTAVKSNVLTAVNSPPEFASFSVTPASVYTDSDVTVSAVTRDHDKDVVRLTYDWKVNGKAIAATTVLSGLVWFDKGDTIELKVTPNDGDVDGTPESRTIKVKNRAPSTPTIDITPGTPKDTDDLRCLITKASVDADGDSFTYHISWERNGVAYTGATTTTRKGDTIPGSVTKTGETWTCFVSADDGDDESVEAEDEVTVGGGVVPGFSGYRGPTFTGWTQCEGYLDHSGGDHIPKAWGDDCMGSGYNKIKLVCGSSLSSYRYIDVKKNVFRDKLTAYPERGLITAFKDQSGRSYSYSYNYIYATNNDPHHSRSWWVYGNGCGEHYQTLTVNNSCTYEASNCFGQGISGSRYLWVYVAP